MIHDADAFDRTRRTLEDFLQFAHAATRLVARGRASYNGDEMLRLAAEALLHRIGEVVARLDRDDPELMASHPEVNWRAMKGMRNVIAHNYGAIDDAIVWTTLERDVPREAAHIERILTERSMAHHTSSP